MRKVRLLSLATFLLFAMSISSVASADCPVPNTLTNGQVADADNVMANFDALANCSVATTGSPTAGSLSVFSGAKSITTGNLTGDVTTAGSTTTTLSASGVTPGTYSNSTVTVDAKGRVTGASSGSAGGGGSGGIAFDMPVAAAFSQVNFTNASVSDGTYAMSFVVDGIGNTDDWALLTQSQTGAITKVAHIINNYPRKNFGGGGIILRESSSGKFISLNVQHNTWGGGNVVRVDHWNSPTSLGSAVAIELTENIITWLRVDVDATDRVYSYSIDGLAWIELYRQAVGTFITSDEIGLGAQARNESGTPHDLKMSVWHWGSPP